MKKHIFWILPFVIFIILVVSSNGTTYFNRNWFNVKHALFFGLFVYVLIMSLYLVYRFFIISYINKSVIKVSLGLLLCSLAIAGTITASNLQLKYIDKYEVPHLSECTYYDEYGNIIYEAIIETCPVLNIKTHTYDSLSFTVEENYTGRVTEPLIVENGVGYRYYDADINIKVQVDITYRGPYVETLSYIVYETTDQLDSDTKTGLMLKETIVNNFDIDNQVTITYSTQKIEISMTNNDTFPSFDTVEPVIRQYVSTFIIEEGSGQNDPQAIIFDEITFDEEGLEIINTFGRGQFEKINDPLISVDFYENGIATGNSTDSYFDSNVITIRNSEKKRQSAGADRVYDTRTVTFKDPPVEIYGDGENGILVDTFIFSSFEAELNYLQASNYLLEHTISSINDELFIYDGDYYTKLVFTDYGVRTEAYYVDQFSWRDMFSDDSESEDVVYSMAILGFNKRGLTKLLAAYDYKEMLMTPGYLSEYHFYQHNFLIEHIFIDNYDKFKD